MTVGTIKALAASYLQKAPADFVVNGVDLLLAALNNARKAAELLHDFNANRVSAQIQVDPTNGANLSTAVLKGTGTAVSLKEFITFYLADTNGEIPLYHHSKKNIAVWMKERNWNARGRYLSTEVRYPDDQYLRTLRIGPTEVYIDGTQVYIQPTQESTTTLYIDGVKWMSDYTSDSNTDWMTTHGHQYLMWACVCEVNYWTSTFTPNFDGNLSPPEKLRERALDQLVQWDSFQIEQGRQPRGIR